MLLNQRTLPKRHLVAASQSGLYRGPLHIVGAAISAAACRSERAAANSHANDQRTPAPCSVLTRKGRPIAEGLTDVHIRDGRTVSKIGDGPCNTCNTMARPSRELQAHDCSFETLLRRSAQ